MTTTFDFGSGPVPAHRHPNGGGWVADTAQIEGTAYIGPNAQVFGSGSLHVTSNIHLIGKFHISDNAQVSNKVIKGLILKSSIPILPDLDAKILNAINQEGCFLKMRTWHTCETTHCRAGWAIHLGDAYALENEVGPWLAGALIYQASTGRIPDFFASNEGTLKDLSKGLR